MTANGQKFHADGTKGKWKPLYRYADRVVRKAALYRSHERNVDTGTDRGGAVKGWWTGHELKMLTMYVGVSNRDYIQRYILRSRQIVAIDDISVYFNPITQSYSLPKQETLRRYLVIDKTSIYETDAFGKHVTKLKGRKLDHVHELMVEFDTYKHILEANKNGQSIEQIVIGH
jgi:hypothetical protein